MAEPIDSNWTQCLNKDMDVVHSALEESFHEEVVQTFPHVCEMCGKEYTTRSGLWKHRAGKHETEASNRRLTCAICDETFVNKGHLEGHVNMHHGLRPHVCSICNSRFAYRSAMLRHMAVQHRGGMTNSKIMHNLMTTGKRIIIDCKRKWCLTWDQYFMGVAFITSQRSKDPVMQVGSCIVNKANRVVSTGYNGMPNGCDDSTMPWGKGNNDDLKNKTLFVTQANWSCTLVSNHMSPAFGMTKWCKLLANDTPLCTCKAGYDWQQFAPFCFHEHEEVCHSELNAILNARAPVAGCTIYVTLFPCSDCAKAIIQSGIREVVYYSDSKARKDTTKASKMMLKSANVKTRQYIHDELQLSIGQKMKCKL